MPAHVSCQLGCLCPNAGKGKRECGAFRGLVSILALVALALQQDQQHGTQDQCWHLSTLGLITCFGPSLAPPAPVVNSSAPTPVGNQGDVVKRCPKVNDRQTVIKSAFCYCANLDGSLTLNNQGAIKGIMLQEMPPGVPETPIVPGPFCNIEEHPELCVQAQCGGTKVDYWCDKVVLSVVCGYA
jgi:hypothetical protein